MENMQKRSFLLSSKDLQASAIASDSDAPGLQRALAEVAEVARPGMGFDNRMSRSPATYRDTSPSDSD